MRMNMAGTLDNQINKAVYFRKAMASGRRMTSREDALELFDSLEPADDEWKA